MIRIVGLSATLPNYLDVAMFLNVRHRILMPSLTSLFHAPWKSAFMPSSIAHNNQSWWHTTTVTKSEGRAVPCLTVYTGRFNFLGSFYIFECYLTFPFILNWYAHIITLLQVNLYKGLFYFDSRFRPVPLKQTFVGKLFLIQNSCNNYHCGDEHVLVHFILHTCFLGVRGSNKFKTREHMDVACYEKVLESVKNGDQVSTT